MSQFDPSCIDVADFLSCLEIEAKQATDKEIIFSCPFPNHAGGDSNPSAYMNLDTTAFYCHSCHEKGNAVHFTQKVLSISPIAAVRMLRARYQPGSIDPDAWDMVKEVKKVLEYVPQTTPENVVLGDDTNAMFEIDWQRVADVGDEAPPALSYMLDRGFDPETLEHWGIGWDYRSDRVTIPVLDEWGRIVGFKGRAWRPDHRPKYLIMGDAPDKQARYGFPRYQKSLVVFGLFEAFTNFETLPEGETPSLIVCEGELDVLALWQAGYNNAVAVNGSELSERQVKLLSSYADKLTIFLDSDDAGAHGTQRIVDELAHVMPIDIVPEHEGDPASMTTEQLDEVLRQARPYLVWEAAKILGG